MSFFGINSMEFLILLVAAMVLVGPDKLPEYVAKLRDWVQQMRGLAEGAKTQLKDQMGPEFQDVDWRQYDPRQYDPRKIVRQALFDEPAEDSAVADVDAPLDTQAPAVPMMTPARFDPDRATPWDLDAT